MSESQALSIARLNPPGAGFLEVRSLSVEQLRKLERAEGTDGCNAFVLGTVHYTGSGGTDDSSLQPRVRLELPLLSPAARIETWLTHERPSYERRGPIEFAINHEVLFGHLVCEESASLDLPSATREAFTSLLRLTEETGHPHLLRIWTCLPAIHGMALGLERYKWFCLARAEVFESRYGERYKSRLCASTAVGSQGGPLVVHFLASRRGGRHWENPRQVNAYDYPPRYGPRSPSFARATSAHADLGGALFLSGTASIVGHQSLHSGDIPAQLEETLENLRALRRRAAQGNERPEPSWSALGFVKVYLRDPRSLPLVEEKLAACLGEDVERFYIGAEICRAELLLEIEGVELPGRVDGG
jgi:chorismate lyase/3-hydroxybenzoate synthase